MLCNVKDFDILKHSQEGHNIMLFFNHDIRLPRMFVNSGELLRLSNMERGSFFEFAQNCLLSIEVNPNLMDK